MSLIHEFSIIKESDNTIDSGAKLISISDVLILYMGDSLKWIDSSWNGKMEIKELNYYGDTIIKNENIKTLKNIIHTWVELFELSPEEFTLTGNYLLDENKYEKNLLKKEEVLLQLKSLYFLCERAIKQNSHILHNGI